MIEHKITNKNLTVLTVAIILICLLVGNIITPNKYLRKINKNEMPQFIFAEEMNKIENPTLLNYGFLDGGFYTAANILPNCKAFCELTVRIQEMLYLQEYYTENGLCDFIVTDDYKEFEKYDLIKEAYFYNNENDYHFYLYKLKN